MPEEAYDPGSGQQCEYIGATEPHRTSEQPLQQQAQPQNTQHIYTDLQGTFKTLNRLVDDIAVDLNFVTSELRGILRRRPLEYSDRIVGAPYNRFEVRFLNEVSPVAPAVTRRPSINGNDTIVIMKGLLFSNSEPSLSKTCVFHLRISAKIRECEKHVTKNEFHLIDLAQEDETDLALGSENPTDAAIPRIVDSASYVCSLTQRVLRIEIYEPEFDAEDLHEFEIGPINLRHRRIQETYTDVSEQPPSPAQCLYTLFKALRGPLVLSASEDQKSIPAYNKSLNLNINPQVLLKKMFFQHTGDEFFPPNMSDREDIKANIIRESYERKITEIILLGTKAYSQGLPNPFAHHQLSKSFDTVFRELGDTASTVHHRALLKEEYYINISAFPFYSDDLIISCYENTVATDQENTMKYFDSLRDIRQRKANLKLSNYVSHLVSSGVIGQRDLDFAYKNLNIDPSQASLMDDDLLLTMYKNEVDQHPLDSKLVDSMLLIANQRKSEKIHKFLDYEPMPLHQAYELLDTDSSVDDDVITTALLIKKSDSPSQNKLYNRAFITIASERKSFALLDEVEREFKDLNDPMTFKQACEYLGADENADELQYINIFQIGQAEIKKARHALRIIGMQKNSKLIESFLRTGLIDRNSLPANEWPVGLANIGNTCYLNSLLQYYFSIKPIRDKVLDFEDVYEEGLEIYKVRRIGGRLVDDDEIERSFQFIYQLRDLFYEQIHTKERCIVPARELAFLAFLPGYLKVEFEKNADHSDIVRVSEPETPAGNLIDLNSSTDDLVMVDPEQSDVGGETIDLIVQNVGYPDVQEIDALEIPSTSASILDTGTVIEPATTKATPRVKAARISESEIENALEIGRQQDVTECIGNVLSQIEAAMKPDALDEADNEQIDFIKRLFYGKTVAHLIQPNDSASRRRTDDKFSNLYANVKDRPRHLYGAIDNTFASEGVTLGGEELIRTERITHLPPILQIQIQRVYYDTVQQRPYKDTSPLPFPETLYMDRYFDTNDSEIIEKRKQSDEWKSELLRLKQRREKLLKKNVSGLTYKDSLKSLSQWLNDEALCESTTREAIEKLITRIDEELLYIYNRTLDLEQKIDHQFDGFKKHGYSIFAIFIHRGEASYGHYWIYIRDRKRNVYRKYNDDVVTEVTAAEVLNHDEGNTATPYFLAYVREDSEDMVDPLCRIVD